MMHQLLTHIGPIFTWNHLILVVSGVVWFLAQAAITNKSQIDIWCNSNPRRAGIAKLVRGFLPDPLLIKQGATLIFKGRLPASYLDLLRRYLAPAIAELATQPNSGPGIADRVLQSNAPAIIPDRNSQLRTTDKSDNS